MELAELKQLALWAHTGTRNLRHHWMEAVKPEVIRDLRNVDDRDVNEIISLVGVIADSFGTIEALLTRLDQFQEIPEADVQVDGIPMHDAEGVRYNPPRLMGESEEEYNDRKAKLESDRRAERLSSTEVYGAIQKAKAVWGDS